MAYVDASVILGLALGQPNRLAEWPKIQREKLSVPHSRPMPVIGPRCHELRIPDQDVTWRTMYRVDSDAVIVAEVFAKKTHRLRRSR